MHDDDHDRGLSHDLHTLRALASRRSMLRILAGASLLPFVGCLSSSDGGESSSSGADQSGGTDAGTDAGTGAGTGDAGSGESCSVIPEETAGPYPGDGSNGANALLLSGIVRSDIRKSLSGTGSTAQGVPLTVKLTVLDSEGSCAPLAGYAVYLWHCDRDGAYSMYSGTASAESYLRGVQQTDADGVVSFTTVFPACYSGRWPHIHFEVYPSLSSATNGASKLHTSQLAMPEATCKEVYADSGYSASVTNLSRVSLQSDNVFSDGATLQLPSISGDASSGYVARLQVVVPG